MSRKISNEKKDKLVPVTAYLIPEKKEQVKKLASSQGTSETEILRQAVDLILNVNWYNQNIDEVSNAIMKQIEPFMQSQINRSIACIVNSTKASATSTYMLAYFLNSFVPEEKRRNYRQLLFRCNEMAKEFSGTKGSNIGVLDRLKIDDELFLSASYMTNEDIREIIEKYTKILDSREGRL
ncbi:MAG: hypothetical protein IKF97_06820 [Clostridia bacterium]|nr:hypothetical protein [Clostridia bacterium]